MELCPYPQVVPPSVLLLLLGPQLQALMKHNQAPPPMQPEPKQVPGTAAGSKQGKEARGTTLEVKVLEPNQAPSAEFKGKITGRTPPHLMHLYSLLQVVAQALEEQVGFCRF